MKYLHRAIIIFAALAAACLILSCSTKKKATERFRSQTEISLDNSVSEKENRLEQNDCTAVSTTTIDWKSIQEALQVKPLDPDRPGKVKFTPEASGGFTVETENVELNTSKVQEEKQEVNIDSIYQAKQLQLEREYESKLKVLQEALEKERKAKTETERWPFWFLSVPLVIGALIYFRGWKFWKKKTS